jgi:glycosyltransferase involved in cell wall biosynthesis
MNTSASSRPAPLVSIGMPVYNCEGTIAYSIASIINQTLDNWELRIIDDGSTDNTIEIIASFKDPRITVLESPENKGLPTRLNECVAVARGRYFARMDGDDIAYPTRLKKQVEYLESHSEVDLIGSGTVVFRGDGDAYGIRRAMVSHKAICGNVISGLNLAHPTWVGRSEWFRRNPYRNGFRLTEDKELLMRTRNTSRFAALSEPLLGYREEHVYLRKIIPARYHLSRAYMEDALKRGNVLYGLGGVTFAFLKSVLDTIAISTGTQDKLLRHRARPLPDQVKDDWTEVWQRTLAAAGQRRNCEN